MAKQLSSREKVRLAVFGGLMLLIGFFLNQAAETLMLAGLRPKPTSRITVREGGRLKQQLARSPFPPGTRFRGLTREWNFEWERDMLEMAPWTGKPFGSFVKKFDAYGFPNDAFIPLDKPENEYRILVMGDSNTEGYCPNRYAIPQVLERLAQKTTPKGKRIRVINMGISASGLFDMVVRYDHLGRLFHPDTLVLVVTLGNDLIELLPQARYYYVQAGKKGFEEYGPVTVHTEDERTWKPEDGLGQGVQLEEITRRLQEQTDQPFRPRRIRIPPEIERELQKYQGEVERFHRGAFHQWGKQRIYLGRLPELFPALEERVKYCFWRLEKVLEQSARPPKVFVLLLPSAYDLRTVEVRGIVEKIESYLRQWGIPPGPAEQQARAAVGRACEKYLGLRPGREILDPAPEFRREKGVYLIEDFHFAVEFNHRLAQKIRDAMEREGILGPQPAP